MTDEQNAKVESTMIKKRLVLFFSEK